MEGFIVDFGVFVLFKYLVMYLVNGNIIGDYVEFVVDFILDSCVVGMIDVNMFDFLLVFVEDIFYMVVFVVWVDNIIDFLFLSVKFNDQCSVVIVGMMVEIIFLFVLIVVGDGQVNIINGLVYSDYIWGGVGDDIFNGGNGVDIYFYCWGDGNDIIIDLVLGSVFD